MLLLLDSSGLIWIPKHWRRVSQISGEIRQNPTSSDDKMRSWCESQDFFTSLGETVQAHFCLTTVPNNSPICRDAAAALKYCKASLPWETVPLYFHCCSWMSLVVISQGGDLNRVDTWAQKGATTTDMLVKHLCIFNQRTHIHKNAAGQDNKAGGLKFPMYVLTALHFLFTVL